MTIKTKFARIQISAFFLAAIPLIAVGGFILQYAVIFLAIILHEAAHIVIALHKGGRLAVLKLMPIGVYAELDLSKCSYRSLLAIYAGGPAVNYLIFATAVVINHFISYKSSFMLFLESSNLYLAAFNLIPVFPLDGGKLLQTLLRKRLGIFLSAKYIRGFTGVMSIAFVTYGVYRLVLGSPNASLLFIGIYMLFLLNADKMEAPLMNIKQILYRRSKLLKKGVYPSRELVALKNRCLNEVVKAMDFDRFHLIHILDDDLKLLKTITENELIEALLKYKSDITFEELLRNIDEKLNFPDSS